MKKSNKKYKRNNLVAIPNQEKYFDMFSFGNNIPLIRKELDRQYKLSKRNK